MKSLIVVPGRTLHNCTLNAQPGHAHNSRHNSDSVWLQGLKKEQYGLQNNVLNVQAYGGYRNLDKDLRFLPKIITR